MKKSLRASNIELMRIIAMLMIIGSHLASHGVQHCMSSTVKYQAYNMGSLLNKLFVCFLNPGGETGVALFFMITGYFQIKRKKHKSAKIILECVFYSWFALLLYVIVHMTGGSFPDTESYHVLEFLVKAILNPASGGCWWFITAYIIIMAVSPLLNDLLIKLNLKGFIRLIFFVWFFWYTIASLGASYYPIERGIFFYSIGAYIRLYGRKLNTARRKIISVIFFCIAWAIGTYLYFKEGEMSQITQTSAQIVNVILLRTAVTAFIIPITAITLFKLFESFDIGSNRAINAVASTSLGVYLIHDSILGRSFIWYDLLKVDTVLYSSVWFPIFAVVSILFVFSSCFIIDTIRIRLFEPKAIIKFDLLFDKLRLSFVEEDTKE